MDTTTATTQEPQAAPKKEPTIVNVCSQCQHEPKFKDVNAAIIKAEVGAMGVVSKDPARAEFQRPDIAFSHGVCKRHYIDFMRQLKKPEAEIEAKVKTMKFVCPDMEESPELVKQYAQGIFTPEDLKKSQSATQMSTNIKEIFRKRAGLIS